MSIYKKKLMYFRYFLITEKLLRNLILNVHATLKKKFTGKFY